jgi:hypothetical protein
VLGLTALLTALATVLPWFSWWWGTLTIALVPPVAVYGLIQYRDAGWALYGTDRLVLRTRHIDRVTAITLRRRLQERSVSQNPFQRRAALASFHTAIAAGGSGGRFALVHLDAAVVADLVDRLGPRSVHHPLPSPHAANLTTVRRDDDDSSVEFRTPLLPDRHDGTEGTPDCDRPPLFEPPRRFTK